MKSSDYYRERAAEVRKMAGKTSHPKVKARLTEIATEYETLAKEADEIARSGGPRD